MPDEEVEEVEVEVETEVIEDEPPEKTEGDLAIEALAQKMGWNPEHTGVDREFVDAPTYILRSKEIQDTMRTQIKSQGTEISGLRNDLSSGLNSLQQHQKKVADSQIKTLEAEIASLKRERRTAIKEGDADLVDELDEQIDGKVAATEDVKTEIPAAPPKKPPHPDFAPWHKKNPWYQTNTEMTAVAEAMVASNEGLEYSELLKLIDEKMRNAYPDSFPKEKKDPPPAPIVEAGGRKPTTKKTFTRKDLSEQQKKACDDIVKLKVMTQKEYIQDLVKIGALT